MNERVKKLWTTALRSSEFQQGCGALRTIENGVCLDCCLGVLCELYRREHPESSEWESDYGSTTFTVKTLDLPAGYESNEETLPQAVWVWAGLDDDDPDLARDGQSRCASSWNDDIQASFTEIADMIEANL